MANNSIKDNNLKNDKKHDFEAIEWTFTAEQRKGITEDDYRIDMETEITELYGEWTLEQRENLLNQYIEYNFENSYSSSDPEYVSWFSSLTEREQAFVSLWETIGYEGASDYDILMSTAKYYEKEIDKELDILSAAENDMNFFSGGIGLGYEEDYRSAQKNYNNQENKIAELRHKLENLEQEDQFIVKQKWTSNIGTIHYYEYPERYKEQPYSVFNKRFSSFDDARLYAYNTKTYGIESNTQIQASQNSFPDDDNVNLHQELGDKKIKEIEENYSAELAGIIESDWQEYLTPDERKYVSYLESLMVEDYDSTNRFIAEQYIFPENSNDELKEKMHVTWAAQKLAFQYNEKGEIDMIEGKPETVSEYLSRYEIPSPKHQTGLLAVDGIYQVTYDLAQQIKSSEHPKGRFWYEAPDKTVVFLDKTISPPYEKEFGNLQKFWQSLETPAENLFKSADTEANKEPLTDSSKRSIYVCSPLAGQIEQNINNARNYGKFVATQGGVPLAPHVTEMFDDLIPAERELGLAYGIDLLKKADEIWVFGETISKGMQAEIEYAREHNIPISQVDINTFAVIPFPDTDKTVEKHGYTVITENRLAGFGYNPDAPERMAAWKNHENGTLEGIVSKDSFTLSEYKSISESVGLNYEVIWDKLDRMGIKGYIEHENTYDALSEVTIARLDAQKETLHKSMLKLPPEEILDKSYEYVYKNDINTSLAGKVLQHEFTQEQLEVLKEIRIDDIYQNQWRTKDYDSVPDMLDGFKEQLDMDFPAPSNDGPVLDFNPIN